jgi:C1A family cysteine protease
MTMLRVAHHADGSTRRIHLGGWKKQFNDPRDAAYAIKMHGGLTARPSQADLRSICSPIEDQGELGSCTAHMAAALVEANEGKRAAGGIQAVLAGALPTVGVADVLVANGVISFKTTIQPTPAPPSPPSPPRLVRAARLFQYYATRKIEGSVSEDSGASIRDAVKAMNLYGVGDESLYPYDVTKFAVNPPQNVWAAAATHKVTSYHSIADGDLESIKAVIASGFLVGFGFNVYDNFMSAAMARTGILHLPGYNDAFQGGHAVAIVGYDDSVKQFIVRNSWGLGWGLHGYFMMDYAYLANTTLSSDLWAVNSAPI